MLQPNKQSAINTQALGYTHYTTYPLLRDRTDRLYYTKHRKAHLHHIGAFLENVNEIKILGQ